MMVYCEKCKVEIKDPVVEIEENTYYKKISWYRPDKIVRYIYCKRINIISGDWVKIEDGYSFPPDDITITKHWDNNELDFNPTDSGDLNYAGLLKKITKKEFFEALNKIPINLKKHIEQLKKEGKKNKIQKKGML